MRRAPWVIWCYFWICVAAVLGFIFCTVFFIFEWIKEQRSATVYAYLCSYAFLPEALRKMRKNLLE